MSLREDGKAVKMAFWGVEKGQETLEKTASLPGLNRSPTTASAPPRKAQGEVESQPMQLNTTKPKTVINCKCSQSPCVAEGEYFRHLNNFWNKRNTLPLTHVGAFVHLLVLPQ
ncbi:MAG: hypothetical protein JXM79_06655, partial [Sedimentisphaerales bacterium]|nr:hypothetical protein [Sedimentisphaerales bacterium]